MNLNWKGARELIGEFETQLQRHLAETRPQDRNLNAASKQDDIVLEWFMKLVLHTQVKPDLKRDVGLTICIVELNEGPV
jgi:hypothetical protein